MKLFDRPRRSAALISVAVLALVLSLVTLVGCDQSVTSVGPESDDVEPSSSVASDISPQLQAALGAQNRNQDDLLNRPGIVGVGTGLTPSGKPRIVVYAVSAEQARQADLPSHVDGVPVAVEVTGMFVAGANPTTKARPAPVGFSVGHPDITAGTYGARVKDGGGNLFMLSNNHVLADVNNASIGDPTLQPGPYDGGTSEDKIAELYDYEPIDFQSDNTMDAAISDPVNEDDISASTPTDDGYGAPSSTAFDLDGNGDGNVDSGVIGTQVQKYGRTTGLTQGEVSEINVTAEVCYVCANPVCTRCEQSATFVDQIGITPGDFSDGGDSGSLIVTNNSEAQPVALLYAGSDTRTLGNRIDLVLSRFGVTVDDGSGGGGDTDSPPSVSVTNPSDGATVSGSVTITADASDDGSVSQVEFFVDGNPVGTDTDGSDGWSTTWESDTVLDGDHTITAEATDDAGQTSDDSITITVDNTSGDASTMHVGDLDGSSQNNGSTWAATVTVTVHDGSENPVSNVAVSGTWDLGGSGTAQSSSCTTGTDGTCSLSATQIPKRNGSVSYTVDDLTNSLTYDASANHDPDGDSNGTTITVSKP